MLVDHDLLVLEWKVNSEGMLTVWKNKSSKDYNDHGEEINGDMLVN